MITKNETNKAGSSLRHARLDANELLANASEKELKQLDENLFFDVYRGATKKKRMLK